MPGPGAPSILQVRIMERPGAWHIILLSSLLVLMLLDAWTTVQGIQQGHRELNPLMASLIGTGLDNYLAVKIGGTLFLAFGFAYLLDRAPRIAIPTISLLAGFMLHVVLTNFLVIS